MAAAYQHSLPSAASRTGRRSGALRAAVVLLLAVVVVAVLAVADAAPRPEDKYTSKYDSINIDEILASKRLLQQYVDCILEKAGAKCTPDALELKRVLPEALTNDCQKCTDKQNAMSDKMVKHIREKEKDTWVALTAKFDPTGSYEKKYFGS